MKCVNCGADFQSADLKCPYCGAQNVIGEEWKKERSWHEKRYQQILAELKSNGFEYVANRILNKALVILGIIFVLLSFICVLPSVIEDLSLQVNKVIHKTAIEKEMKAYHETGQWDKLLKIVDEYDMYGAENYVYTQAAIMQNEYQNYLMKKMTFLDMSEEEKQRDSYYLNYAIRYSYKVYWVDCGIYSELDSQNIKKHELFSEEIVSFWKVTLGMTEEELQYFMENEHIKNKEFDDLVLKIKERKAWQ